MTRLAVAVPTRSRPQNVRSIVEAWHLTGAFGVADLHFVVDCDDLRYQDYIARFNEMPEVHWTSNAAWMPLVPKLNAIASLLSDSYGNVVFMGDDHLPRTPMWAHILIADHLSTTRPHIWYGQDGYQDQRLPTWWSMDSRIIRALGRMVPAPVQHLYCDNAVKELGEAVGCLRYDERILIEHMHPINGKGTVDAQYERVNRPQQYERDGETFKAWLRDGLGRDATLVREAGG